MDKLELFAWSAHICTKTRPCSCFRLHKSLFKPWQRHTRADVSRDLLRKFGRRYVFLLFWSLSPPSHCGDVPCRAVPSHRVSAWVTLRELWVLTSTLKLLPLPRVAGPWLCVCVCVCVRARPHLKIFLLLLPRHSSICLYHRLSRPEQFSPESLHLSNLWVSVSSFSICACCVCLYTIWVFVIHFTYNSSFSPWLSIPSLLGSELFLSVT